MHFTHALVVMDPHTAHMDKADKLYVDLYACKQAIKIVIIPLVTIRKCFTIISQFSSMVIGYCRNA